MAFGLHSILQPKHLFLGTSLAGGSLFLLWGFKKRVQRNAFSKFTNGSEDLKPETSKYYGIIDESKKVKKAAVYTRTGDTGSASLYNGERRAKNDVVFEALGATDELNGILGVAREHCVTSKNGLDDVLAEIQSRLFDVGAAIATPRLCSSDEKVSKTQFSNSHTKLLEQMIDHMEAQLPPLTTFILPSGGLSSANLHLARSICRRAERRVVPLAAQNEIESEVLVFLNRLSDFLFSAARFAAYKEGRPEIPWKKVQ